MSQRRKGRGRGDPPARDGGDGPFTRMVAAQQEAGHGARLGRKLQPARGGQRHGRRHLGHHARQARMAQPFLHDRQDRSPPGFGVDHAMGLKPGRRQARSEQVPLLQDPQHRAMTPRQDAGHEQGGRGPELHVAPAAHDLVQGGQGQATPRKGGIQIGQPERENVGRCAAVLQADDGSAQLIEGGRRLHVLILF